MSDRAWDSEIQGIGDKIAALTVSKAVELGDYLEEVHKIKPAAGGGGGGGGPVAQAAPVAVQEEPTEFKVSLDSFDAAKKINVIKVIREITGLGLKEAKDAVEGAPKVVKEGVSKEDAAKFLKQIEDGGGKGSVKPM